MTIFFSNSSPKITKLAFLLLHEILEIDKFEGADFKYGNRFSLIPVKKYPNKTFLVRSLGMFVFSKNFPVKQFGGC